MAGSKLTYRDFWMIELADAASHLTETIQLSHKMFTEEDLRDPDTFKEWKTWLDHRVKSTLDLLDGVPNPDRVDVPSFL